MMAAIIYIELIFAQPGSFRNWKTQTVLIITVISAYLLRTIAMRFQREGDHKGYLKWRLIQAVVLTVLVIIASVQCAAELCQLCLCFELPKVPVGLWYLALPILLGFQVSRIRERVGGTNVGEGKRLWIGFAAGMVGLFYFFTVTVFGYGVYHYIPAGKGGGDFSSVSLIQITLVKDSKIDKLPQLLTDNNPNEEFVLIEGTSTSIFIANPADNFGPLNWRKGMDCRPRVVELPRSAIGFITYTKDTYSDWVKNTNTVGSFRKS